MPFTHIMIDGLDPIIKLCIAKTTLVFAFWQGRKTIHFKNRSKVFRPEPSPAIGWAPGPAAQPLNFTLCPILFILGLPHDGTSETFSFFSIFFYSFFIWWQNRGALIKFSIQELIQNNSDSFEKTFLSLGQPMNQYTVGLRLLFELKTYQVNQD